MEEFIREGIVGSVNPGARTVRVIYPLMGNMTSGDLKVLHHTGAPVTVEETEVEYAGEKKKHTHEAALQGWMPSVGQRVLCLCPPTGGGDGFVLGGL